MSEGAKEKSTGPWIREVSLCLVLQLAPGVALHESFQSSAWLAPSGGCGGWASGVSGPALRFAGSDVPKPACWLAPGNQGHTVSLLQWHSCGSPPTIMENTEGVCSLRLSFVFVLTHVLVLLSFHPLHLVINSCSEFILLYTDTNSSYSWVM